MKLLLKTSLMLILVLAGTSIASAQSCEIGQGSSCYPTVPSSSNINGRWEYVHITGDAGEQAEMYQGGYSTILTQNGSTVTGSTAFTTSDNLAELSCCSDVITGTINTTGFPFNQTTTVKVTFDVAANSSPGQPHFQEIYTGTLNVPSNPCTTDSSSSCNPTTITGTYTSTAGSAYTICAPTSHDADCKFTATWFPAFKNSSYSGGFDGPDDGTGPSNVPVNFTLTTTTDNSTITGTLTAGLFAGKACFDGTVTLQPVTNPEIIGTIGYPPNTDPPYAAGVGGYLFGMDKNGVQLWVNWYSTNPNGDPAAVGEMQYAGFPITQTADDGTNITIIAFYGITGGVCDGYGGGDAPFVLQGQKPAPRQPRRDHGHRGGVRW
jgi:hypothetical protein